MEAEQDGDIGVENNGDIEAKQYGDIEAALELSRIMVLSRTGWRHES